MQQHDDRLVFSPSDLNAFLACPHLTSLQVAAARGELAKPFRANAHADLIRRKGDEHEAAFLASLGDGVARIEEPWEIGWDVAARATEDAMGAGAPVVYQAAFKHDGWRGLADFLLLRPDGSYEALDTKLARRAKPAHVLQLCFYTEQIARIQGRMPAAMHVVGGTGEQETFRPEDYLAYYRRLRDRFVHVANNPAATYPYPVEHCGLCDFLRLCQERWERDDHLTLVAGVSRRQVERLTVAQIDTLTALAQAQPGTKVKKMRATTFEGIRHQAELQLHHRETGKHRVSASSRRSARSSAVRSTPGARSRSSPRADRATSPAVRSWIVCAASSKSSASTSPRTTSRRRRTSAGRTSRPRSPTWTV
jgi:predicted RecB family nuclease